MEGGRGSFPRALLLHRQDRCPVGSAVGSRADRTAPDHELLRERPASSGRAWLARREAVEEMRVASRGYGEEPRQQTGAWLGGVA
ncbi:hypothetical protein NN561_014437 [Cricetulus griseus]